MLRVFGLLLLITAFYEAMLLLIAGPGRRIVGPDGSLFNPVVIGQEIGAWLMIFTVAAVGAAIVAVVTRKKRNPYPGLTTGAGLAMVFTVMAMIGRIGI